MVTPYNDNQTPKVEQVRKMFNNIAPKYDLLNRIISLGLDRSWRRKALDMLAPYAPKRVLDVATGTGDLAIELLKHVPSVREVLGIDISEEMMRVGASKVASLGLSQQISFSRQDSTATDLETASFDAATIGFGIRNFTDIPAAARELHRLLRPSGVLVIIELSEPTNRFLHLGYSLYTRTVIPMLGRLLTGDKSAYTYLPKSIAAVPQREQMTEILRVAGFREAFYHSIFPGACTIYIGINAD
ncbi:bifunctional demethylmenaquinone methyltransferase/2-methoxy-6-polyprenyl-1,4-benzoquinol methylase UbiE [Porphyromonas sp. oral taxon 275]|uniref:bifunctional demethylmenaquinone methyltransferase/2-methoxy-6-polyprenyl-1,4-benzoquinol methylase UbiE n=1 Tax=Porphyromonas sp. oral taxon 275 TaxID=712435 RepID=UPI001BAC5542|nr:bifunctional demethylmenaquinone methyltransferase/2-methoxy-6-polyprenyl-1,4-benzoquinol methylase UbiE [Porphyromonas sp. oral taxon 275]QUB43089.1 bifunctional demethylmenaquinone methyltransferase/2-methoxy-6-polyprenyl-1,4-benzoquinol methylase UbiE [Porphyromonas sp. oral taxon 275]